MELVAFREHDTPLTDASEAVRLCRAHGVELTGNPEGFGGRPDRLGIVYDGDSLRASMYVGAQWLVRGPESRVAAVVEPKYADVDYVAMLLGALEVDGEEAEYFSRYYDIDFDSPAIECPQVAGTLTPLVVMHYMAVMKALVAKGLRRRYVQREENLNAKIKGHLIVAEHLRRNEIGCRRERVYCRYTEFSADTAENRMLKRALVLCRCYMVSSRAFAGHGAVVMLCSRMLGAFAGVGDGFTPADVRTAASGKIYREYAAALRLADMILRYFDNSPAHTGDVRASAPPFWIDMPRLYELYVLGRLREVSEARVLFQLAGYKAGNVADFVVREQKLILDAKYKKLYEATFDHADIMELSCYARDERLLPELPEDYAPRCIIIYPGADDELCADRPLDCQGRKIAGYRNFYRLSVPLPRLAAQNT